MATVQSRYLVDSL